MKVIENSLVASGQCEFRKPTFFFRICFEKKILSAPDVQIMTYDGDGDNNADDNVQLK